MKIRAFLLCVFSLIFHAVAAEVPLPRSSPEAQGISSSAIRDFVESAHAKIDTLHSFMLVRHGSVVAEGWWQPEKASTPHVLWSLSKSFTATAVGFALAEGKLSLDDPVLHFFPAQQPEHPSPNLQAMRVRHLLSMSGGHDSEPKFSIEAGPSVRAFFEHPVEHAPGSWFRYNTPGSYMLSAIVTKVTGQTVLDYLTPRLFELWGSSPPDGTPVPKGTASAAMDSSPAPRTSQSLAFCTCKKGSGTANSCFPRSG